MKKIPLEYLRFTCSSSNSICFPHKILHTFCFQFIKGKLLIPREIENKAHAKVLWRNKVKNRDLYIRGRERLRVRDLTFAYSQNIDFPESYISSYFTRKVSTVTFSEGGYALSPSQNDKTSNI